MSVGDSITCECNNCVDEEIKTVSVRHAEASEALEHLFVLSSKASRPARECIGRPAMDEADHRHRRLLRARRERPPGRTADERDEFAPSHALSPRT
jgi:hypothetical protein